MLPSSPASMIVNSTSEETTVSHTDSCMGNTEKMSSRICSKIARSAAIASDWMAASTKAPSKSGTCRQPSSFGFPHPQFLHPLPGRPREAKRGCIAQHRPGTSRFERLGYGNQTIAGIVHHPSHAHASRDVHPLTDFRRNGDLAALSHKSRHRFHLVKNTSCRLIMSTRNKTPNKTLTTLLRMQRFGLLHDRGSPWQRLVSPDKMSAAHYDTARTFVLFFLIKFWNYIFWNEKPD